MFLFTAAPYCYGPTSKVLCVAEELAERGVRDMVYVGMEPGLSLVKNSVFSEVLEIEDRDIWTGEPLKAMREARGLISSLDYRSLRVAKAEGKKSIFIDTLLWLREKPPPSTDTVACYIAQRFFESAGRRRVFSYLPRLEEVGPILPRYLENSTAEARLGDNPVSTVLVSFGGLKSPAMRPGADRAYISLALSILDRALPPDQRIVVALPRYLEPQARGASIERREWRLVFPTQRQFHCLLERAQLLITVPGLETVYEAITVGLPLIFLPPYNGTQLFQQRVYAEYGIPLFSIGPYFNGVASPCAGELNRATSDIQKETARLAEDESTIQSLSESLACFFEKWRTMETEYSESIVRNQESLKGLGPPGRTAAGSLVCKILNTGKRVPWQ